jgi:hypothetical protein
MAMLSRAWCGALGLLVAAGCGREPAPLAPVSGRISFQGKPLAGGTIVFTPDPERGGSGPLAFAEVKADGSFTLRTGAQFGAVPGWHRVTVASAPPPAAVPGAPTAPAGVLPLPPKYSDPERSGLHQEVKAGLANTIDLRLD